MRRDRVSRASRHVIGNAPLRSEADALREHFLAFGGRGQGVRGIRPVCHSHVARKRRDLRGHLLAPVDIPTFVFLHDIVIHFRAGGQQGCLFIGACSASVQRAVPETVGFFEMLVGCSPLIPPLQPPPWDAFGLFADDGALAGPLAAPNAPFAATHARFGPAVLQCRPCFQRFHARRRWTKLLLPYAALPFAQTETSTSCGTRLEMWFGLRRLSTNGWSSLGRRSHGGQCSPQPRPRCTYCVTKLPASCKQPAPPHLKHAGTQSRPRAPLFKLPLNPLSDRASTSLPSPVHAAQSGTGISEPHVLWMRCTWHRPRKHRPQDRRAWRIDPEHRRLWPRSLSSAHGANPPRPTTHTPSRHLPSATLLLEGRPASGVQCRK